MSKTVTVVIATGIFFLNACGASTDELSDLSAEAVTAQAAGGDAAAMQELERRTALAAQAQSAASVAGDPKAEWQTALYSGDQSQIDAMVEAGNPYALTYAASLIGANPGATEAEKVQARNWIEAAAAQGHGQALYRMSEDHLGPSELYPMDEAKALALGIQAAEAGDHEAMYKTGVRYQYGLATAPQDNAIAIDWFNKAKAAGNRAAQRQLDELSAQ